MRYRDRIEAAHSDPYQLERLFQTSQEEGNEAVFNTDIVACHRAEPDNLLYAAWVHRLETARPKSSSGLQRTNWRLALPLSLATGLILWLLSDSSLTYHAPQVPYLAHLGAPVLAVITVAFLNATARKGYRRSAWTSAALAAVLTYVMSLSAEKGDYLLLMAPHILLLSWCAVGYSVIGTGASTLNKFAFLIKSIEAVVTVGVFLTATFVFSGITLTMFEVMDVEIADAAIRLLFVGLPGSITILAIAIVYDPLAPPMHQEFKRGIGRLIATFPRVLLALTIVVLVIYLVVIMFNFMAPFENRAVLIIYNVMLFSVMGLLVGATPVSADDVSEQLQIGLRSAIIIVTALVVTVSLYSLAAVVYRTITSGLTINRITVLGWNSINIGLLAMLIVRQFRCDKAKWIPALQQTFSDGIYPYIVWAVFVTIFTPWLF